MLYQNEVKANPRNYDAWLDYARLGIEGGNPGQVREVYERAIAQIPPTQEKRHWKRYIYLFIYYALYEELESKDIPRARQIYSECLRAIPHQKFTFAKAWLLKAQFEIRQGQVSIARKTLGQAIGMCPKSKIFKAYINLELKLFEFERCRTLYIRFLEFNPSNSSTWIRFAELERGLGDIERARAVFELAIARADLDMPELVWKAYIDFEEEEAEEEEEEEGGYDWPHHLHERLLSKIDHVKVWISYAKFEFSIPNAEEEEKEPGNEDEERLHAAAASIGRARAIFERAHERLKTLGQKEERVTLLQAWKMFEGENGTAEDEGRVMALMPKRLKRRRKLDGENFEEYMDWVFPQDDEGAAAPKLGRLPEIARKWKTEQQQA